MRYAILPTLAAALVLSGCSGASDQAAYETEEVAAEAVGEAVEGAAPQNQFGFWEASAGDSSAAEVNETIARSDPSEGFEEGVPETTIPVNIPQIAYVYDYGFRISADGIAPLQQRHADLCEKKGTTVCRIISMEQSGSEGDYGYGQLQLAVAAGEARAFGSELAGSAEAMDGEQISLSIGGEDLSKKIVDTEARLRARTLLRDRLMEILRNRSGTVAELVEAERGVAQVNEEIDQARSWLTEMKGRVAFSRVTVNYNSGSRSSGSFTGPVASAVSSIGSILGTILAAVIIGLTVLIPLGLLFFALRWIWRRAGLSLRSKGEGFAVEAEPAED
ncbi:DUF4349 domain-containing protein [Pontixanthobacter sp. CEM42]|uniref:DUF4349 domain-containing protein n=1 Tax=Pontixanthobacter sp. CEM42 TaxID=2792077 RepID=UPI001ADF37D6|nr:DUF4349 domain-containing protein [Pontixanthobacter sp. CEM42]